ncbi:calcium uptake protein 2, mitochondrial isoform X1 [Scleropages formosus]|uniref:calcium uptake protein 2, mitochondrial isoform X1 n=1 Tax=Scleropages formosus TaxID=113540 RepID=UPI0010FA889F|nr:calcium uptake protein 2, mitochondrial isoform X1 [Scleropages formosus]
MAYWARVCARLGMGLARFPALRSACAARYYAGVLGSLAVGGLFLSRHRGSGTRFGPCAVHAAQDEEEEEEEKKKKKAVKESAFSVQSARRLRFAQFCSVEYEEEPYMTPRDFLFSVTLENVDRKLRKKVLSKQDVDKMLSAATAAKAGPTLFRTLGDSGLISYTEYLFLLTILTKPHTGFHIAFKMLDVDGNEHVDKKEFLKLKNIIGKRSDKFPGEDMEKPVNDDDDDDVTTTLQAHFFSKTGRCKLQYRDFCRFMEDLQAEVQEMEFLQFSKGMDTMRREDFAEWLLHYTNEEDNDIYLENMKKRIPAGQSITFDEFKSFCLFTNNLEDFALSVKMISEANRPIGMAEFRRAVKIATGNDLSESVLDTVFKIFDLDGDNCLSHKEFIQVMKDRIHRGLKVHPEHGIPGYWRCVKRETLKGAQEALKKTGSPF